MAARTRATSSSIASGATTTTTTPDSLDSGGVAREVRVRSSPTTRVTRTTNRRILPPYPTRPGSFKPTGIDVRGSHGDDRADSMTPSMCSAAPVAEMWGVLLLSSVISPP